MLHYLWLIYKIFIPFNISLRKDGQCNIGDLTEFVVIVRLCRGCFLLKTSCLCSRERLLHLDFFSSCVRFLAGCSVGGGFVFVFFSAYFGCY